MEVDDNFIPCPVDYGDEMYPNGIFEFNITKLADFIKNNSDSIILEKVNVTSASSNFSSINESHIDSVDITKPIIMAEISPGQYNIIDGHHRLEKAYRMKKKSILAYKIKAEQHIKFLTRKKSYEIYIGYWNEKFNDIAKYGEVLY